MLGDGSYEMKDTTEDDDFEEARSQEGYKSPSQEEDPTMTTDKDMTETIPDCYPPTGQPNQPQTAPLQLTQEVSFSGLLSQKTWADQMDEVGPPDNA